MSLRRLISISALALCLLAVPGATNASAKVIWNLDLHHNQTHFPPGGEGQYWPDVKNAGDTKTEGPITLQVDLPPGITRKGFFLFSNPRNVWSCPGKAGASSFTCTTSEPIGAHEVSVGLGLTVKVAPDAEGTLLATAKVEGGGAA